MQRIEGCCCLHKQPQFPPHQGKSCRQGLVNKLGPKFAELALLLAANVDPATGEIPMPVRLPAVFDRLAIPATGAFPRTRL